MFLNCHPNMCITAWERLAQLEAQSALQAHKAFKRKEAGRRKTGASRLCKRTTLGKDETVGAYAFLKDPLQLNLFAKGGTLENIEARQVLERLKSCSKVVVLKFSLQNSVYSIFPLSRPLFAKTIILLLKTVGLSFRKLSFRLQLPKYFLVFNLKARFNSNGRLN